LGEDRFGRRGGRFFGRSGVQYDLVFGGSGRVWSGVYPGADAGDSRRRGVRVDAIAASTLEENVGEDQYVLLARVRFEPTAADAGIAHNPSAGYVVPVDALQMAVAEGQMNCGVLAGRRPPRACRRWTHGR